MDCPRLRGIARRQTPDGPVLLHQTTTSVRRPSTPISAPPSVHKLNSSSKDPFFCTTRKGRTLHRRRERKRSVRIRFAPLPLWCPPGPGPVSLSVILFRAVAVNAKMHSPRRAEEGPVPTSIPRPGPLTVRFLKV